MSVGRGLYVHLPFCPYLCPYCDFAKWQHEGGAADRYLRALYAEIASAARDCVDTVFLGGGTPNTYGGAILSRLIGDLREHFPGPADRETTIEVNPELVEAEDVRVYREAGVTRLSIGVQSFDPAEIRTLGRRHDAAHVERAVGAARGAGLRSVSLDLIFGVPGQTAQSWRRSLERAIALGVDHVSTYGLTIEEGTPYHRWQQREPARFFTDDAEAELYGIAIDMLEAAGYEHYEISNFAKPGFRCEHNAIYWANGEYVGLGVGAASYRAGVRSRNTRELEEYCKACESGRPATGESERLKGAARLGEAAMLALRTAQGVRFAEFKERYGVDFEEFYAPVIARHRDAACLEVDGAGARLTRRGRFVANDVCADFVTFR